MNTVLKTSALIAMALLFAGCQSQKPATGSNDKNAALLHATALKALETQHFVIEASEFFLLDGKPSQLSTDSYLSMKGNKAVVIYSPEIFPRYAKNNKTEEREAIFAKEKSKKNGDTVFQLKIIDTDQSWLENRFVITLYSNTNDCLVQCKQNSGKSAFNFKGKVLPGK